MRVAELIELLQAHDGRKLVMIPSEPEDFTESFVVVSEPSDGVVYLEPL